MSLPKKYKLDSFHLQKLKNLLPQNKISGNFFYINYYPSSDIKFVVIILKKHVDKAAHRNLLRRRIHSCVLSLIQKQKLLGGTFVIISKLKINKNLTYEEICINLNKDLSKVFESR